MSCVREENIKVSFTKSENIRNIYFLNELKDNYINLLSSIYGPKSSLKLIRNSADSDYLTSSSSTLLEQLSFSNPCFKFINALISAQNKTYGVNGLFVGILCSNLLYRALKIEELNHHWTVRDISDHIQSSLLKQLQGHPKISYKINTDKLEELLCVVRSIITSKSYYIFSSKEIEHFSVKIVEVFLKTIPLENYENFGQVHIVDIEGIPAMESETFTGFLFRIHDSPFEEFCRRIKGVTKNNIDFVILTVPLSPDVPKTNLIEWYSELSIEHNYVNSILKILSTLLHKRNVKLIMSQMYIHEGLKYDLEKKGFIVLDRLGTLLTDSLIRATGCSPISSLSGIEYTLDRHIGMASSIKAVNFNDKAYVHFLPMDPVYDVSLILPAVNSHVFKFLKECVNAGVCILRELTKDPIVVPGGGCFESFVALTLLQMRDANHERLAALYQATPTSVNKVFCEYIETFLNLSMLPGSGNTKNSFEFYVDNEFFHLWKTNNLLKESDTPEHPSNYISDVCSCGSISKSRVASGTQFYSVLHIKNNCRSDYVEPGLLKFTVPLNSSVSNSENNNSIVKIQKNSIIDCFSAKLNSIRLAFDGFSELFRLGLCIYDT